MVMNMFMVMVMFMVVGLIAQRQVLTQLLIMDGL